MELILHRLPTTDNHVTNRWKWRQHKQEWEEELTWLLRSEGKRRYDKIHIVPAVEWNKPGRLPDPDNITRSLYKPTLDALQKEGWIEDDRGSIVTGTLPTITRGKKGLTRIKIFPVVDDRPLVKKDYCEYCGKRSQGEGVHHIIHRGNGGPDIKENLIQLCPDHHRLGKAIHRGNITRDELWEIVATREGKSVDEVQDIVWASRR